MNLLKLKTIQSGVFKSLIEALKEPLTDTNIEFTDKGMKIMSMDSGHCVLVHLRIYPDNLIEYECKGKIVIGVSIPNLYKLHRSITQDDVLTWYITENDPNRLGILIENKAKQQITDYHLNLMELNEDEMNIPDHQYPFELSMPAGDLQKICRDMKNLTTSSIDIKQHKDKLIFSTTGEFASQMTTRSPGDSINDLNVIKTDDDEIYQGVFKLEKLIEFTKCTNLGGNPSPVTMLMKNDYPLIIIYPVSNLGEIKLCLAPMVQQSEDV